MKSIELTLINGTKIILNPLNYEFMNHETHITVINVVSNEKFKILENWEWLKEILYID